MAPEDDEIRIGEVTDIHHIPLPRNQRFKPSELSMRVVRGEWTAGPKPGRNGLKVQSKINLIRRKIRELDRLLTLAKTTED
ncbi:MAG: hypothetical protein HY247_05845 [archaeon]|nr:MAG: hypothetical protein HY247_05845 [archaeon]